MQEYYAGLEKGALEMYEIAKRARGKRLDPSAEVEILTARELAGRVESLVSIAIPALAKSGLRERLLELEKEHGKGNEEIGFRIADEVSDGKFFKVENDEKAIEAGMRVGTAYWTLGITTAPLEGMTHVSIKKRMDGGNYLAVYFAGPIRSAGGTTNAMIVMLGDFLRKKFNIGSYDPTPQEIERYCLELESYHNRVTRLQYFPSVDETRCLIKNLPVEVNGEATEEMEVLAYKDLPRVETDRIRGGMVLTVSMIALKAAKLMKRVKKIGEKYKIADWVWLEKVLEKKQESHKDASTAVYIAEIPGGRPVFGYPGAVGGFRLRYGRARNVGLAAVGVHPATMVILDEFIAVGTQIKMELPGKAGAVTPVDNIDGPIVLLNNGSVEKIQSESRAREVKDKVNKILYLGDILVTYGEFLTNGHKLEVPGWCDEWWVEEAKSKGYSGSENVSFEEAVEISKRTGTPLHPKYTYFWDSLTGEEVLRVKENLENPEKAKSLLEKLGVEHLFENGKVIFKEEDRKILGTVLSGSSPPLATGIETVNAMSPVRIKAKGGRFIGTRMGRPEKAERRLMKGKPHALFPAGRIERLRNIVPAIKDGLSAELALRVCPKCGVKTYYTRCDKCGEETSQKKICIKCGATGTFTEHCGMKSRGFAYTRIKEDIEALSKKLEMAPPALVKGVRGISSELKIPERLEKGLLRSKYNLFVNKDGTTRIDATDIPLTHFKPNEVGTEVNVLRELGYTHDVDGLPLESDDQLLELFPQDIILSDNQYFSSSDYLTRVSKFIDELLEKFYGLAKFYNVEKREDLVGQIVIGLAPHTSAGILGRIIGFSKIRAGYAHPAWHAAKKRNCDGDEDSVMLLMDALLNFSREFLPTNRGGKTMDVPLVITMALDLLEVDDEVKDMDVTDMYPLELYTAAEKGENPGAVKILTLGGLGKLSGLKFTTDTTNIASGPIITAYRSLGPMIDKVKSQLGLAEKICAVNANDVAERILSTHFLKDIKGNLRQFGNQNFRCINCNTSYRRFPIIGKCESCGGKIVLTVHEGTIKKYYEASVELAKKYHVSNYIQSQLRLLEKKMDLAFGVKEKQEALDHWLN